MYLRLVPFLELKWLFLFILFFRGIRCWYGFTLSKLYPCPDKTETLKLSLWISISNGFYIWILLLDILVTGIDPDLSAL